MPTQLDRYDAALDERRAAWDATETAIKELAALEASEEQLREEAEQLLESVDASKDDRLEKFTALIRAEKEVGVKKQQVADLRASLQEKDAALKTIRAALEPLLEGDASSNEEKKRAAAASSSSSSKAEEPQRKKTRTELPKGDDDEPIHDMLKHSAFAAFYEFTSRDQLREVLARHNVDWMQSSTGTKQVTDQWVTRGKSNAAEVWTIFEMWWEKEGRALKNASIDVLLAKLLPAYEAGLTRDKAGSVYHEVVKIIEPDILAPDGGPPALKSATIHDYHKNERYATAFKKVLFMWDYRLKALGKKGESEELPPGDEANDSSEDDSSSEDSELSEDDADKDPSYSYRGRKK